MMRPAERDRELIADLAAERPNLGEAQMVRVRGFAATDEAGPRGHELEVRLVPVAPGLGYAQDALIDPAGASPSWLTLGTAGRAGRLAGRRGSFRGVVGIVRTRNR
jgi:hypothetical protein